MDDIPRRLRAERRRRRRPVAQRRASCLDVPRVDGDIYAEPLVVGSHVIAVTENNSVYALDASTGEVVWRTNLGAPVDSSTLPCGNIGPTSGITATPVADPSTGLLFVAGFLSPATHELFALREETGEVIWHRPIDPPGMDPRTQQLRSALTLANDRVYAAYGGLFGDCGTYHGWVAAVNADGTGTSSTTRSPRRTPAHLGSVGSGGGRGRQPLRGNGQQLLGFVRPRQQCHQALTDARAA